MKFKKGDKVTLKETSKHYGKGGQLVGVGTIIEVLGAHLPYIVEWAGEGVCKNTYGDLDLDFEPGTFLWDGVSPVEVGMFVKNSLGTLFEVVMVKGNQVVLEIEGSLSTADIKNIFRSKKTYKEETLEEVMKVWVGQGLDFAYDSSDSRFKISDVFDVVYEVMKGD